jgi:CIC family chloride channel protein
MGRSFLTIKDKFLSALSRWPERVSMPESLTIMLPALLVGVGAGLGAVVFRKLIAGVQSISYGWIVGFIDSIAPFHLLILPALGGLIVGPLIYKFAREAKGHGVPEVMEAVALRGGRIRPRVAIVKSLASAISIGTGGSVGREGPIAQIGSALGSSVGQFFNMSDERIRNLVACGAAGGIAATFNAPIAGSIFALEVILGQFHAIYFGAVVITAVTADVIAHIFEGDLNAFPIPEYALVSPWELLLYVLLGLIAALGAVAFTRLLYLSEDTWDSFPFPEYLKPVAGGLVLGLVGLISPKILGFPRVFGVGYDTISDALFGKLALQMTLGLMLLKLLATIITLGSGGSGGIFAPSLFMGAMLGEAFGQIANLLFPEISAPAGAYALVGMAAFFSGAAHAPVTSILILFEMTGDYRIILPLMLATVISTIVSRSISPESIYTLKLTRRGVHLQEGKDIDVMQAVSVREAMTTQMDTIPLEMPLDQLALEFEQTHHHGFPVVDADGKLAGVVTIQDFERALGFGSVDGKTVADIATLDSLVVVYDDEPMWSALKKLGLRDVGRLPVVKREDEGELVGVIRRKDIIQAYNLAIIKRSQHQHQQHVLRLGKLVKSEFTNIQIPSTAGVVGKRIMDIELPEECLIVSVHRGRKVFIAHGYSTIQAGDKLTLFASEACIPDLRERLLEPTQVEDDAQAEIVDEVGQDKD